MVLKELILDDFEHNDLSKYDMSHNFVKSYHLSFDKKIVKYGKTALKLSFDFGGWSSGNAAMPIIFKEKLSTDIMPEKIAIWVYGDGQVPWLRASLQDGLGEKKTVNLTERTVSWYGWKYIEGKINANWRLPLNLEQIYAVETDKKYQNDASYKGDILFDHLRFVYIDDQDLIGPMFSSIHPKSSTVYTDTFDFNTIVSDNMSGVDSETIKMFVNQKLVEHLYNDKTNQISYRFKQVKEEAYQIKVEASDFAGNKSVPFLEKNTTVDLSPDTEAPILSLVTPTETAIEYSTTPRITFHLIDRKSGINQEDIIVKINHVKQDVIYDSQTGWGYTISSNALSTGIHSLIIYAADRAGNVSDPLSRAFTIEKLKQPSNLGNFKVSVLPDTHSDLYNQLAFHTGLNEDTNFIIQMGDMVDQGTVKEYEKLSEKIEIFNDKKMLTVPGNHESFQGNLKLFRTLFGSPTYHLVQGNTLFIFLNTAFEQSISKSDSTQFTYLQELLSKNEQDNIVVITHVPTKDNFGTSHEMDEEDANKLESVLGNYKSLNQSDSVTVLFGHLHVIDQWQLSGVNYIITGNSARKSYVSNEKGNILGHGVLSILKNNVTYEFLPYVEDLKITHDGNSVNQVYLKTREIIDLRVTIEIDKLSSQYEVDIMDFKLINKKWHSSNKEVVEIDCCGRASAVGQGTAIVTVEVAKKRKEINVNVRD